MASQISQSSPASGPLCLPLSKFSFATVHGESVAPIPWVHIGKPNNLFAVYEVLRQENGFGQLQTLSKFKVLQDPEVMEDIDLDVLASEAHRAASEAQDPRRNSKIPSVTVIVKIPCIAIRYPLAGGQIRRCQLRLANNEDYYEVLKILSRANVPFGEAGSFPTQQPPSRPFSASSSLLRPSDSASHIGGQPVSVSSNAVASSIAASGAGTGWAQSSFVRPSTTSSITTRQSPVYASQWRDQGRINAMQNFTLSPERDRIVPPDPTAPKDGLVSSYFANLHPPRDTPGSAKTTSFNFNPGPIDLYQPRPSTTHVFETHNLSMMLPPKRELPFENPSVKNKAKRGVEPEAGPVTADFATLLPSRSDPKTRTLKLSQPEKKDTEKTTTEPAPDNKHASQASTSIIASSTAKRKRTPAVRNPAPGATKKAKAATAPKKPAKAAKAASTVPSVEELLEQSQISAKEVAGLSNTIDTQALMARIEDSETRSGVEASAPRASNPPPPEPQAQSPILISDSQPEAQTVAATKHPDSQPKAAIIPQPTSNFTSRPIPPFPRALASLMQDPAFAPPPQPSPREWAALPAEERQASLQTWICDEIRRPEFVALCKTIEGSWGVHFAGREVGI